MQAGHDGFSQTLKGMPCEPSLRFGHDEQVIHRPNGVCSTTHIMPPSPVVGGRGAQLLSILHRSETLTSASGRLGGIGKAARMDGFPMRRVMAGFGVGLLLFGCGTGKLSLTGYVDRLNVINDRTVPQTEALISELERSTTPREANATTERMVALRIESVEATEELDPPEQIADLHRLFMGWEIRLPPIEEALAARAGTVAGWEEFYESAEVAAYRAALVEGKRVCVEFQTRLDATAKRGVFADTPWIPGALSEVVGARLGCALFPEDPENVFKWVPATRVAEPSG
jgi:hypothetical protein